MTRADKLRAAKDATAEIRRRFEGEGEDEGHCGEHVPERLSDVESRDRWGCHARCTDDVAICDQGSCHCDCAGCGEEQEAEVARREERARIAEAEAEPPGVTAAIEARYFGADGGVSS